MPAIFNMIQDAPFSAFAESVRTIKLAIDLNQSGTGCKIIGLTSSIPNEGKSSIALSLARLTAQTGAKTLLIDCDLEESIALTFIVAQSRHRSCRNPRRPSSRPKGVAAKNHLKRSHNRNAVPSRFDARALGPLKRDTWRRANTEVL